jgi:agmatinase
MDANHDPNGIGINNGNFIGLPFDETNASLILLGVPWEVTVSYGQGTALGPAATLNASRQLDLYDLDNPDGWQQGIFMLPISEQILQKNQKLRALAACVIDHLEQGLTIESSPERSQDLATINAGCRDLNTWVFEQTTAYLQQGKQVGLIGGDHSVSLGYLQALAKQHSDFGILQIDAHADLREAYEGFAFSHASIMFNAMKLPQVSRLVQVSIRDLCQAEADLSAQSKGRIVTHYDAQLKAALYGEESWYSICQAIIQDLPEQVYVSFDVDGLDPKLCPNTGTPVPGGLELEQVFYLLRTVVESDRKIIGFDVSEIGNDEWDGNVAARIVYKLANLMFLK